MAGAFTPVALHTCDRVPVTADTTPRLCYVLEEACSRGDFAHYETTNFIMGLMRPTGVPLLSPKLANRELSGRGFSFRVPRGPWVLWLVERLFGDLPGDVGGGDLMGLITEGIWVAQPEPFALEIDYTERGGQTAACNTPPRRAGLRFPRLDYEAFALGPVVRLSGSVDVAATLKLLRDTFPSPPPETLCATCRAGGKLRRCAGCKAIRYCSSECQKIAWPAHKPQCRAQAAKNQAEQAEQPPWWDAHRKTQDGSVHFGKLELMTWRRCTDGDGDELGFGGFVASEEEETRKSFNETYGGDEARYFAHRPEGFRWTCCGVPFDIGGYGCDHHGDPRAPGPCRCDFCLAGRPLDDEIWRQKLASQAARGLESTLRRGGQGQATAGGDMNWALREAFSSLRR